MADFQAEGCPFVLWFSAKFNETMGTAVHKPYEQAVHGTAIPRATKVSAV